MANPQGSSSQKKPGSTRVVAGEQARCKRPAGLKIGIAAAVVALIGGGAAVASAVTNSAPSATQKTAAAGNPAAEL
ncbi:MAG: sulfonate ABC transporter substrate-binding protein, partial [Actinomycetes bacterium]